ncbi:LOW QUALITY PROTEIN: probable G-protein coupled receptor Mth-like 8 [Drosophila ficusphila]|uniref:LOW QUALITY PROTEIN: probable G-protein coupled receptor Mth-like 8 n=1 Tax=Drosophila ficusphila TaxID=30025 RepID=UPI0007E71509|nr:LOW QUALITY PROTEIN: probable G-protein coupled receptor Mth-like 8 [Drosophila ficusphila]
MSSKRDRQSGMSLRMAQFTVLAILLAAVHSAHGFHEETHYPCAFIDTAKITGSYDLNGSYVHNWTVIPRHLVAVYDFVIENGIRIPATRHLRGCVCKTRPCVRICCQEGEVYDLERRQCAVPAAGLSSLPAQSHMAVELSNGSLSDMELQPHFSVHVDTPCDHMKAVTKGSEFVHWTLHENGTISHRGHVFSKHYCFTPLLHENSTWEWQPLACAPEKLHFVLGVREWTYAICLLIAILSMFIVLMVYLLCSEMRNSFYGVAIKAYAICLILGYALLAYLTLHNPANLSNAACRVLPGLALMYLVLSFYILSFIAFKLYLSFHGVVFTKLMFWLIFTPIVLIAVGWSFFVVFSYYGSRLIFGGDTCWFDPRNWSIMIYLYAPIFVACAISGFFYILSLIYLSEQPELEKNFESIEKNRFKSFWKYVGYTALVWLVCVSSFAINYYRENRSHLNYAVSFCMAFHGFAALYALIGKNQQIQNFLRRIDNEEDTCENSVPLSSFG